MSDLELVALNITAEHMSINSELQLFRCISGTDLDGKIERSVYNMNPSHNKNLGGFFIAVTIFIILEKEKVVLFRRLSFLNCVLMRAIRTPILLFSDLSG